MDPRPWTAGARSTLHVDSDGLLYRHYHDTDTWDGPREPRMDDRGVKRADGNRSVDAAVARLFDETRAFRGVVGVRPCPPPHLHRTLRVLVHGVRDVDVLALRLGVSRATAWNYVCRTVEAWPLAHEVARPLVHPELLTRLASLSDRSGSLRALLSRLDLTDDIEWRCLPDPYAHLRLARLCLEAAC